MRTTIDLPDDLHRTAKALARDHGWTFNETVTRLLRQALGHGEAMQVSRDAGTGLPSVRLGVTVTSEDVRALDDET